jgi:hypothetical protein
VNDVAARRLDPRRRRHHVHHHERRDVAARRRRDQALGDIEHRLPSFTEFAVQKRALRKNLAPLSPHSPALGMKPWEFLCEFQNSFGALALTGATHVPRLPPREQGLCPA